MLYWALSILALSFGFSYEEVDSFFKEEKHSCQQDHVAYEPMLIIVLARTGLFNRVPHHADDQHQKESLDGHMNLLAKNWSVDPGAEEFKDACFLLLFLFEEDVTISGEEIGKDNKRVKEEQKSGM